MTKLHGLEQVKHVDVHLAVSVLEHAYFECVLPRLTVSWGSKQHIASFVGLTNFPVHVKGISRDLIIVLDLLAEGIEGVLLHIEKDRVDMDKQTTLIGLISRILRLQSAFLAFALFKEQTLCFRQSYRQCLFR